MERSISKFVLFLGLNFFFCPAVSIYKQISIHQLKNSNLSQIFAYFELDLQKFEQVEADIRFFDWSELKLKKENRTRKLFGQMKYFVPADNSFQVEMTSFTKQGGEYRKLPFRVARKICAISTKTAKISITSSPLCRICRCLLYVHLQM